MVNMNIANLDGHTSENHGVFLGYEDTINTDRSSTPKISSLAWLQIQNTHNTHQQTVLRTKPMSQRAHHKTMMRPKQLQKTRDLA